MDSRRDAYNYYLDLFKKSMGNRTPALTWNQFDNHLWGRPWPGTLAQAFDLKVLLEVGELRTKSPFKAYQSHVSEWVISLMRGHGLEQCVIFTSGSSLAAKEKVLRCFGMQMQSPMQETPVRVMSGLDKRNPFTWTDMVPWKKGDEVTILDDSQDIIKIGMEALKFAGIRANGVHVKLMSHTEVGSFGTDEE